MKLKTLKDLHCSDDGEFSCCTNDKYEYECEYPHAVNTQELKEEAIKWVKHWRAEGWQVDEFKEFFNITEEDLN